MTDPIDDILKARPLMHGEFTENSRCTWEIMRAMQAERNWPTLDDKQKHSLYMIAHKMARIVTGDPDAEDHWDDIIGYAKLVVDRIRNPIIPYDAEDIYSALASGWGCDRDTALARVRELQQTAKAATQLGAEASTPFKPGQLGLTPNEPDDDGSQHAAFSDEELEKELKDNPF